MLTIVSVFLYTLSKHLSLIRNKMCTHKIRFIVTQIKTSNHLWELKAKNKNYKLNWEILCRTKPNSNKTCKDYTVVKHAQKNMKLKMQKKNNILKQKKRKAATLLT